MIIVFWVLAEAPWHSTSTWNVTRKRNFKLYWIRFLWALSSYDWLHFSETWPCSCPSASENPSIRNSFGWVLTLHYNWWLYLVRWCRNSWTVAMTFCRSEKKPSTNLHIFIFIFVNLVNTWCTWFCVFLFFFPSSLIHSSSESYLSMQWELKKWNKILIVHYWYRRYWFAIKTREWTMTKLHI